jgi:zinc transport system permease protein
MENILTYGFMQRALLAGLFIALACAILGVFLVLRRDAMIGHGLAHITFGGVALGLFLEIKPLLMALTVVVLCSLIILKLREKAGVYEDTAIGIFSSVGMAIGIILATLSGKLNVDLFSYLFGSILAIEKFEVGIAVTLALTVIIIVVIFYQEFLYQTFDTESARTSGIRVGLLDGILAVLTSVTIVIGMKVVGILLIAALIVIPSAAGLQLANSFKQAMVVSSVVSISSVVTGLFVAYYWDLPASGTIVLLSFLAFLAFGGIRLIKKLPQYSFKFNRIKF